MSRLFIADIVNMIATATVVRHQLRYVGGLGAYTCTCHIAMKLSKNGGGDVCVYISFIIIYDAGGCEVGL